MVASVVSKTRGGLCIDMMQLPCLCTYVLLTVAKIGKISAASEAKNYMKNRCTEFRYASEGGWNDELR
mgnify:CR=1 FL=1